MNSEQETVNGEERYALTPWGQLVPDAIDMISDAIEIADSSARSDVECHCPWTYLKEPDDTSSRWYDTDRIDPEDAEHIEQALRYLGARGRLNVHPTRPELVNFVGVPE